MPDDSVDGDASDDSGEPDAPDDFAEALDESGDADAPNGFRDADAADEVASRGSVVGVQLSAAELEGGALPLTGVLGALV